MTDLHVVRHGHGRPMLVVHGGLGLDHTCMRALDRLGDAAELVYVDVPGNGRSPHRHAQTLESIADDLDALRAALGLERWLVLGHSYGSFLALTYAARHPTRVAGLVAVGTAPAFDHAPAVVDNLGKRDQPAAAAALLAVLGQPVRDDAQFAEVWTRVLPLYFHRYDPAYQTAFANTRWSAAGYNRGNELLATYDVRGALARITAPALVLGGDDDFITPPACGAEVAAGIAGARLAILAAAGHFPHLEQPAAFDREVRGWLAARA